MVKFIFIGSIYLSFFLTMSWAQTPVPKDLDELKLAIINLKVEPTPEEIRKAKSELITKRLNEQFASGAPGNINVQNSFEQQARLKEFMDCVQTVVRGDLFHGLNCRDDWKALMMGDIEVLKKRGLPLPDEFVSRMKNELETLQKDYAAYTKEDEVIVIDEYMKFETASPEILLNAQAYDPNILSLSQNMKEIVLKMYKSDDPVKAINNLKENKLSEVPDELFVLGEMLELITGSNCENEATYTNGMGQYLLKDLAEKVRLDEENKEKKNRPKEKFVGNYLIGVKTNEPLTSIPTYRFVEDGVTYYLYQGKKRASEEVWVMAKLLPDGKLEYNYFKLIKEQPDKTSLKKDKDIALLSSGVHKTSSTLPNDNKFYFQAQEGLVIQTDEISAPVIGKAVIPEAKLVISRVHMAYLGKNNLSQANFSVRHDSVLLQTQSKPLSGLWSVGSDVRYSPLNGKWNVNSNLRVENLLMGYGINSSGDSSANISYIVSRNFATIQTDIKNDAQMTLGRQFKKNDGYVTATTNFKSIVEVKLVLIVK